MRVWGPWSLDAMAFGSMTAQTMAVNAGGWRKVAGKSKNPKDFSGTPAVAPLAATRTHYLTHLAAQETSQRMASTWLKLWQQLNICLNNQLSVFSPFLWQGAISIIHFPHWLQVSSLFKLISAVWKSLQNTVQHPGKCFPDAGLIKGLFMPPKRRLCVKKLFTEDYNQLSGEQPSHFLTSYFACMHAHICVWVACSHAHTLFAIFPDRSFADPGAFCSVFIFIKFFF